MKSNLLFTKAIFIIFEFVLFYPLKMLQISYLLIVGIAGNLTPMVKKPVFRQKKPNFPINIKDNYHYFIKFFQFFSLFNLIFKIIYFTYKNKINIVNIY